MGFNSVLKGVTNTFACVSVKNISEGLGGELGVFISRKFRIRISV